MDNKNQLAISAYRSDLHKQLVCTASCCDLDLAAFEFSSPGGCHAHPPASEDRLQFERLHDGRLLVTNRCPSRLFRFRDRDCLLEPGATITAEPPFTLVADQLVLAVFNPIAYEALCNGCRPVSMDVRPAVANIDALQDGGRSANPASVISRSPSPDTLTRWFKQLALIHRQAACSPMFYTEAIRAVVETGGLDSAMLLERTNGAWRIQCSHVAPSSEAITFEPHLAELVSCRHDTLVYASPADHCGQSLFAAPVFDHRGGVAFVLFATRQQRPGNRRRHLRELEALWVQLVAETITSGVIRAKQADQLDRQQELLARSYPADVSQMLSSPDADLVSVDRDVTVMFADLIGSTPVCGKNSPEDFLRFQSEVMEQWTSIITGHGGTIVDYHGDGLVAMWNAPLAQADHARLACEAALAIQARMPATKYSWQTRLNYTPKAGVGVHTGSVTLGNSGTHQRIKYGPRGIAVHLASRIEQATRALEQPVLISEATRAELPNGAGAYRLGQFRLRGIDQPVALYALHSMRAGEVTNPCCDAKHCELQRFVSSGNYQQAASILKRCQSCAFDELSLSFLHGQLDSFANEVRDFAANEGNEEPIFDLTNA